MPLTELICRRSGYKNAPLCYSDQVLIMDCSCSSSSQWSSLLTCLSCQPTSRSTAPAHIPNHPSKPTFFLAHLHFPLALTLPCTYQQNLRCSGSGSAKRSKSNNPDSEVITHGHVQNCHTNCRCITHQILEPHYRLARIPHIGATLHGGKKELHGRLTRSITLCHEKQPQYHHHCHQMLPPV